MSDRNIIIDKIHEVFDKAREIWWNNEFPLPTISFTKRGKTAGTANFYRNTLNFNMVLFRENRKEFLMRTVPHECSHLIANHLYSTGRKVKPHGREWKSVMRMLGYDPKRCHSYDTKNATVFHKAKYVYTCSCGDYHTVTITIHRKIENGSKYTCKTCKSPIKFVCYAGKVSYEEAIKKAKRKVF